MLNTVLTVRAHQANSHRDIGWEKFTDAAIGILNQQDRPMVFILWGRPAQTKKAMLNNPRHFPGSAPPKSLVRIQGIFRQQALQQDQCILTEHGLTPVDWQIENI